MTSELYILVEAVYPVTTLPSHNTGELSESERAE